MAFDNLGLYITMGGGDNRIAFSVFSGCFPNIFWLFLNILIIKCMKNTTYDDACVLGVFSPGHLNVNRRATHARCHRDTGTRLAENIKFMPGRISPGHAKLTLTSPCKALA